MLTRKKISNFAILLTLLVLMQNLPSFANPISDTIKIPIYRQLYHDKIDKEQIGIDQLDGSADGQFHATPIQELNTTLTYGLFTLVDRIQTDIEISTKIASNNEKIRALLYVENTLLLFKQRQKLKLVQPSELIILLDHLELVIQSLPIKPSLNDLIRNAPYGVADIMCELWMDFPESDQARNSLYLKYLKIHPSKILNTISDYIHAPFADSLIHDAAKRYPSEVYTQSQSTETILGKSIQNNPFPLVKKIVEISKLPNALMYFPFLDDLYSGARSIQEISKYIRNGEEEFDSVGYYKLLVKTEINYIARATSFKKDTPIAMFGVNGLRETLRNRAVHHFITPINQLHDEPNLAVRMRSTDSLSATELYYMMVLGENEIYTSSFKHAFHRMLSRMGPRPRTDSLLLHVRFDYFKKFIKMCAGYNKLDSFLSLMPAVSSNILFKAFVSNLDNENSLEDATDVADAFSSISDQKLKKTILSYVIDNESIAIAKNNTRGKKVYFLLKNIFLSEMGDKTVDINKATGVESIYDLKKSSLMDDSGRIIQQVFFYGDEDGKAFFPSFLKSFENPGWRIVRKPEWVEIFSTKSKMVVYANLPLNYDANLDDSAQKHLNDYFREKKLKPTIVIHRGHSYWLPGTINRMSESARIVIIGSCGGYKNLSRILEVAPDAQIISTKEIGAGDINRPIMTTLNQTLLAQDKIIWKDLWQNLTKQFDADPNKSIRDTWENYVPPYRNLGAIFIKAYNKKELML